MPEVVLSEYVEPELAAIWDYIAFDNFPARRSVPAPGTRFLEPGTNAGNGFVFAISGSAAAEPRSFRVAGFENYLIFYGELQGGIEVFHVIHAARDFESFWESV